MIVTRKLEKKTSFCALKVVKSDAFQPLDLLHYSRASLDCCYCIFNETRFSFIALYFNSLKVD